MNLYPLTKRDYKLVFLLIIVGVGVGILEGFGIAVFFPLLQGPHIAMIEAPFPFDKILEFFNSIPLSRRIQIVAIVLTVITVLRVGLMYVNIKAALVMRALVMRHAKLQAIRQMMGVGMSYFNKRKASDLQIVFENHIEMALGTIVELLCNIIPAVITTVFLILLLFIFSWEVTLAAIVLVTMASFSLNLLSRVIKKTGEKYVVVISSFNKVLLDIIFGMKVVRLFNREEHMTRTFEKEVNALNDSYSWMATLTKLIGPAYELTGIIALAMVLLLGSFFIPHDNNGQLVTILLTFLVVLARLVPQLKQLNHARSAILARLPAIEELKKFLAPAEKEYVTSGQIIFSGLKEGIELRHVDFGYNPQEVVVLHDMSLVIPKGKKVGIVGASGSGKSTIAELLLRFYDPQKGDIFVDGINLKDLETGSWRRHIGVVSQDTFLFHDTIKANIAFGNSEASDEEITRAARQAHAHEFIEKMSNGYETVIGDRGVLLSGGQRQRLAIARAILLNPDILIFDEATSSLDTNSEKIVQQALDDVGKGKTVVTIAHRLSTIANSDKIIVIENGRVVEEGTQQELLAKNGLYRAYARNQSLSVK